MSIPTISGGIFNFSDAGYFPTTWSGGVYDFAPSTLYQIYTDLNYVYAAIGTGLDIIDIDSEHKGAYIHFDSGFKSVWGNDYTVYVATSVSGIKCFSKNDITININTPVDLTAYLMDYLRYPRITSDNVKYIHGYNDKIMCCTSSGVDFFQMEPNGYRSKTTVSGAYKCFVPDNETAYYITISGGEYSINKLNTTLMDWVEPSEVFNVGTGLKINDLYVTSHTSAGGTKNTLFIATSSGIYVIDEENYNTDVYYA